MDEISHLSSAEIVWYFPETREQYRLHGTVNVVKESNEDEKLQRARVSAWKNMSDPGRQQFLWPMPGELRHSSGEEDRALFDPQPPPSKDEPVARAFCLCYFVVDNVDHLCLKTNERTLYNKTGGGKWEASFVNP